jgi:enoyl-[acyl-carrier protein] reductase/trans-2-enoyl-CoA reductase (NAD+)
MAPVDLVIYSLASPKRIHPRNGKIYNSALKPTGQPYTSKTIELESQKVVPITLEPASEQEIADTVAVMGGDDWKMWIDALLDANLLAPGARTLAYSYVGPAVTWPIYRDGTIGHAKQDLELAAADLDKKLSDRLGGHAWVSVNKAVVTQASSAIPVVPLYLSLLPPIMRSKGLEEGPIEQMRRLFFDHLADGKTPALDDHRRIRLDDRELRPEVQAGIIEKWPQVTTENLLSLTDFAGFRRDFRNLFGFDVEGVDYEKPVEIDLKW